nr:hypothetical protein [Tanacetum cinerariifolium]
MEKKDGSNMKEGIATRVNIEESGAKYVAATFEVSLINVGDLCMLIKCIEDGKPDELLSGMTNDDRMETLDALGAVCNSIKADNTNDDVIPCKVSHVDDLTMAENINVDESTLPSIVWAVNINTMSTSYARAAGASAKDQPKVNFNFHPLVADPVFDGVNISIPNKVVEKAKHRLKKIMMNSKGFFFFKFESWAGLEAVLEGGPWLIRKSPIILKKWSMDTRLLKEELTRIPIWVKLHDVPIQVFEEDDISLIATSSFSLCLIDVNSEADLVDIVTICIPSLTGDGFTKETICVEYEWRPPRCDLCKIFGHVHDHCPNKMVCPPILTTSNVVTLTVEKTNDGFQTGATNMGNPSTSSSMLKTTSTSSKKDNIPTSNSYFVLNDEEGEEEVVNVYNETAKLSTKIVGSSPFTAVVG